MAATEIPAFSFDFEDVEPIVLLPPDDLTKSFAVARADSPEVDEPDDEPDGASIQAKDKPADEASLVGAETVADKAADMSLLPRNRGPESPHKHPIPSMQDAFNESLVEATHGVNKPRLRERDVKARRECLIAQARADPVPAMRWRCRPGQEQHELCKLMAQIAFGMYLLLRGLANSDDQVVSIIQGHIDEIDEFVEVALEDLQQANADLSSRIKHLRLPLEHIEVFEKILEDRSYRAELLKNNEVIEHILVRTTVLLGQYEKDMTEGLRATKAFANYLREESGGQGLAKRPEVADIYDAMKGNTNGWHNAFVSLDEEAQKLNTLIAELTVMVGEMQMKAGEVSRRTWVSRLTRITRASRRVLGLTRPQNMIEPFSIPGVTRGEQATPSPPPSVAPKSAESDSVRESVSTVKAPSQRLTIRTQLSPARESPFDERANGGDSGTGSQSDDRDDSAEDLYILQPRTYTPRLPAPLPSPMVKEYTPYTAPEPSGPPHPILPKRSSLRQRTSAQGKLPESIQIPPPMLDARPRTSPKVQCPPDSAYGSDGDGRNRPGSATDGMPSPRSEFQAYHPVQASPYSPLQQRPHTSHTSHTSRSGRSVSTTTPTGTPTSTSSPPRHVRNQPSRLGGASTLSKVTTLSYASNPNSNPRSEENNEPEGGGGGLRKKRSALGWLRKAFALDEDEKAAFEARREAQARNLYYEERSRTFLDGRRVKERG